MTSLIYGALFGFLFEALERQLYIVLGLRTEPLLRRRYEKHLWLFAGLLLTEATLLILLVRSL